MITDFVRSCEAKLRTWAAHSNNSYQYLIAAALIAATAACGSTTDPSLPTITVTLTADRTVATPGEIVEFTATATNRGTGRVQIGVQCGPSMDVAIAPPAGEERSALADQLGPNGASTCPLRPEHFVEPGQTQTFRISWLVPATRGTYTAVAGLRRGDGLGNLSTPVQLVVR
jgi:hypothetical protein